MTPHPTHVVKPDTWLCAACREPLTSALIAAPCPVRPVPLYRDDLAAEAEMQRADEPDAGDVEIGVPIGWEGPF